jgi:hypothetical protein
LGEARDAHRLAHRGARCVEFVDDWLIRVIGVSALTAVTTVPIDISVGGGAGVVDTKYRTSC